MFSSIRKAVAEKATLTYIKSDMVVGLGTGSTANYVVHTLGKLLSFRTLENITCVATSVATEKLAAKYNIPVVSIDEVSSIDVAIDGADEVDYELNLIKGRGGALFREKYIEQLAKIFVVIVDDSKLRSEGFLGPIPVEIVNFGCKTTATKINNCVEEFSQAKLMLRETTDDCQPFVTDNGNRILDIFLPEPLKNIQEVGKQLKNIVGVVEHGIFAGMADVCFVGKSETEIDIIYSKKFKPDELTSK